MNAALRLGRRNRRRSMLHDACAGGFARDTQSSSEISVVSLRSPSSTMCRTSQMK